MGDQEKVDYIDVPKGQGDEIETPPWLVRKLMCIYAFDTDVCSTPENAVANLRYQNALEDPWMHVCGFMNPPYSTPAPFLEKAAKESPNRTTVALIKGDPSTRWWNEWVKPYAQVEWIPKRVRFFYKGRPTRHVANFPSVIAVYHPPYEELR